MIYRKIKYFTDFQKTTFKKRKEKRKFKGFGYCCVFHEKKILLSKFVTTLTDMLYLIKILCQKSN